MVVDMSNDNGTRTLYPAELIKVTYRYRTPVALWKSEFIVREAVEETIGKYIKDITRRNSLATDYPHGETKSLKLFSTYTGANQDTLEDIDALYHKTYVEIAMPIDGNFPAFGEKLSWIDNSLRYPVTGYIRVRSRRDDYVSNIMTLEGEGEFSLV
jgi:hypothetical protein